MIQDAWGKVYSRAGGALLLFLGGEGERGRGVT